MSIIRFDHALASALFRPEKGGSDLDLDKNRDTQLKTMNDVLGSYGDLMFRRFFSLLRY